MEPSKDQMKAAIFILSFCCGIVVAAEPNARPFKNTQDREAWLENMIVHHRFTPEEVSAATGLSLEDAKRSVTELQRKSNLKLSKQAKLPGELLKVLPYPGGRHPRIGFLEGAIDPQRETKLSIFTPWDEQSYVVADVPEAIWSNLGLTYLAHKHIDTIWTKQKIDLPKLEWERLPNGDYRIERILPNGLRFGTHARSTPEAVLMKMWLSNGTTSALSDLRVQNCVMLKATQGFAAQTNSNKVTEGPFQACHSDVGERWIITAWKPLHRAWANAPVPCLHSDPKFPDTNRGENQLLYGLVSFFEGKDIHGEFKRLDQNWDRWMKDSFGVPPID
jgi:hypothetical protein